MAINRKWFEEKVAASSYGSLHVLASHMKNPDGTPFDTKAKLYKVLSGVRELSLYEAYQMAELLEVDLAELALHAFGKKPKR